MINQLETRNIEILKQILASYGFKASAMFLNFLIVPLSIEYLGQENYGIWLVISSFISWFTFLDFGIGNGLRNTLTEMLAKNRSDEAKSAVSVAYISMSILGLLILVLFIVIYRYIDWHRVFNIPNSRIHIAEHVLMPVVIGFVFLLVLKLINSIFFAVQKPSFPVLLSFVTQLGIFIAITVLGYFEMKSLKYYGIVFGLLPATGYLLVTLHQFNYTKLRVMRPAFSHYSSEYFKSVFGIGSKFFLVQVFAVILYTTDNMIISHIFSPSEVVPYNTSFKYFSIASIIFSLAATPYWSAFTDAYHRNQIKWIRDSMRRLNLLALLMGVTLIVMFLLSPLVYQFWLDGELTIPRDLSLLMAVFTFMAVISQPFVMFINGIGKIRIQLLIGGISAVANLPLSIFFASNLGLGPKGVILATTTTAVIGTGVYVKQYFGLISGKATGIWNK